jgi:hypothetical protein
MEIGRSPLASGGRPAGTAYTGTARAAVIEPAAPAQPRARARSSEPGGRVLQGELLQRDQTCYQSTLAYINERAFDHARAGNQPAAAPRARAAIAHYLTHTGSEPASTAPGGRSINYFV